MVKAQAFLNNLRNFNLRNRPLVTRNAFAYPHSVIELFEAKSNNVVKGCYLIGSLIDVFRNVSHALDDYHEKCYREALEILKKVHIDNVVSRVCPR